jgi:hypothetical protein
MSATHANHPGRAEMLAQLSIALGGRSIRTGSGADLDQAVDAGRQAVAAAHTNSAARTGYLLGLAYLLEARFAGTGSGADLDEAVEMGRQAVAASPAGHPNRTASLSKLAGVLHTRFERTGRAADLDEAVDAGRRGALVEVASPGTRARAARGWGRAAATGGRWAEAVAGFEAAVELVGRVASRGVARVDQEHLLEQLGGLGADTAACCVRAGLSGRAVELFEQGRGVLLGQALDTRTDLTALGEAHPALADRFNRLAEELDRADDAAGRGGLSLAGIGGMAAQMGTYAELGRAGERLREAAEEFERLIAEVRQLPGFDRFLLPPPLAELQAVVGEVPVVAVAVSRFGSYALVVTATGVLEPLPLPEVTPDSVAARVDEFLDALRAVGGDLAADEGDRAPAEARLEGVLGWL